MGGRHAGETEESYCDTIQFSDDGDVHAVNEGDDEIEPDEETWCEDEITEEEHELIEKEQPFSSVTCSNCQNQLEK